jgi:hypothetical protein
LKTRLNTMAPPGATWAGVEGGASRSLFGNPVEPDNRRMARKLPGAEADDCSLPTES